MSGGYAAARQLRHWRNESGSCWRTLLERPIRLRLLNCTSPTRQWGNGGRTAHGKRCGCGDGVDAHSGDHTSRCDALEHSFHGQVLPDCTKAYVVALGEKRRGWASRNRENPTPSILMGYASKDLALTDSEHLRTTLRADALSRWLSVLHGDGLGVLHLPFNTTLHAIGFHTIHSPVFPKTTTLTASCQAGLYRSGVRTVPTPRIEQSVVQAQRKAAG